MSTLQASPPYTLPSNRRPQISLRLVVLLALVGLPFLYFGYVIVDQALNKGIKDRGTYFEVDLKSMGSFPFDAVEGDINNVPQQWRDLDGKRVMLTGEMYAGASAAPKVSEFQLVYSIQKCCFGGPPKVQERVFVKAPPGKPVPFYWKPVRVVGTLHVQTRRAGEEVISVFEMDAESLEPVG